MSSIRQPAIAGTFYPADADVLAAGVDRFVNTVRSSHPPSKAIVAPHAGHIYSGPIAGTAYATLRPIADRIRRVVMVGPCHRVHVRGLAIPSHDSWRTPLGDVPIDRATIDRLSGMAGVEVNDEAHAPEHCLEVHLPFLQRLLPSFSIVPILCGDATPAQVDTILQECWGGPETLIVISSDLSHYLDYETASNLDRTASETIERLQPADLGNDQACGRIPIRGLLRRARNLDMRATTLDLRNSGDTAGSRDRVVGYGAYAFEYARTARLDDSHRDLLCGLGRKVLAGSTANGGRKPKFRMGELPPQLRAMRATFVTLTIGGELRGCVGSIMPTRPLALDVAENSYRAAFGDPRFPSLGADEVDRVEIGISILSTPRPVPCSSENELIDRLNPDSDGLILVEGDRKGLFLPHVWESLPDPRLFLGHLKAKAGLPRDHWSQSLKVFRFATESFAPNHG